MRVEHFPGVFNNVALVKGQMSSEKSDVFVLLHHFVYEFTGSFETNNESTRK